jgi:hypothetical protein
MRAIRALITTFIMFAMSNFSFGYGGIGIEIRLERQQTSSKNGWFFNPVITKIAPHSPASRSGLQVGDVITAVEGINTYNRYKGEKDVGSFIGLLKGAPGSDVSVTVQRRKDYWLWQGEQSKTFALIRYNMGEPYEPAISNKGLGGLKEISRACFEELIRSDSEANLNSCRQVVLNACDQGATWACIRGISLVDHMIVQHGLCKQGDVQSCWRSAAIHSLIGPLVKCKLGDEESCALARARDRCISTGHAPSCAQALNLSCQDGNPQACQELNRFADSNREVKFVGNKALAQGNVVIAEEEIPMDNRHGDSAVFSEHEFSKTVTTTLTVEKSSEILGGLDAKLWSLIEAKIKNNVGKSLGIQIGTEVSRKVTVKLEVPPHKFVVYRILWKQHTLKGRVNLEVGGNELELPYETSYGLFHSIESIAPETAVQN